MAALNDAISKQMDWLLGGDCTDDELHEADALDNIIEKLREESHG